MCVSMLAESRAEQTTHVVLLQALADTRASAPAQACTLARAHSARMCVHGQLRAAVGGGLRREGRLGS